jgi:hypothetical protein
LVVDGEESELDIMSFSSNDDEAVEIDYCANVPLKGGSDDPPLSALSLLTVQFTDLLTQAINEEDTRTYRGTAEDIAWFTGIVTELAEFEKEDIAGFADTVAELTEFELENERITGTTCDLPGGSGKKKTAAKKKAKAKAVPQKKKVATPRRSTRLSTGGSSSSSSPGSSDGSPDSDDGSSSSSEDESDSAASPPAADINEGVSLNAFVDEIDFGSDFYGDGSSAQQESSSSRPRYPKKAKKLSRAALLRSMMSGVCKLTSVVGAMSSQGTSTSVLKVPKLPAYDGAVSGPTILDFVDHFTNATLDMSDQARINMFPRYIAGPDFFRDNVLEKAKGFTGTWERFRTLIVLSSFPNKNAYAALLACYNNYEVVIVREGNYYALSTLLRHLLNLRSLLGEIRKGAFQTEGDFVRHFLTRVGTAKVREFLALELLRLSDSDGDSEVSNNTVDHLRKACNIWGQVQSVPHHSNNLVMGRTSNPLSASTKFLSQQGQHAKMRQGPNQEVIEQRKSSTSSKCTTQVYNHDEHEGDEQGSSGSSDSDEPAPKRRKARVVKTKTETSPDKVKEQLKELQHQVEKLKSKPKLYQMPYAPAAPVHPTAPAGSPPVYDPIVPPPRRTVVYDATAQRSGNGSLYCSFCREVFGSTPCLKHYSLCEILKQQKRRCMHYQEGCQEAFDVPDKREDGKANLGAVYVEHLAVCPHHECIPCKKKGEPCRHASVRCPRVECHKCHRMGHKGYICHYFQ